MKKSILSFIFIFVVITALSAQEREIQFATGTDLGLGLYSVDSDILIKSGGNYFCSIQKTDFVYLAPGISFSVRVLNNNENGSSSGFFFRDRAIFPVYGIETGTINDITIDEEYLIAFDDEMYSFMEFDLGFTTGRKFSDNFRTYSDMGINITIMELQDLETVGFKNDSKLNYLGAGFYLGSAVQVGFGRMYMELGVNTVINVFSSTKAAFGEYQYKDTGRWDLMTVSAYLQFGWRY